MPKWIQQCHINVSKSLRVNNRKTAPETAFHVVHSQNRDKSPVLGLAVDVTIKGCVLIGP
jgi:hypothetical protein